MEMQPPAGPPPPSQNSGRNLISEKQNNRETVQELGKKLFSVLNTALANGGPVHFLDKNNKPIFSVEVSRTDEIGEHTPILEFNTLTGNHQMYNIYPGGNIIDAVDLDGDSYVPALNQEEISQILRQLQECQTQGGSDKMEENVPPEER